MKREPVWNPYRNAGPLVDPHRSLNSHMGICSVKYRCIEKAKRMREDMLLSKQVNPPQEHDRHMIMPLIHHHESNKRPRNKAE